MAKATKKALNPALYDVIRRPVITEKSQMALEYNKYVFIVAPEATKADVKAAVEGIFDVKVTKVNIQVVKGKRKVFRGTRGQRKDEKKAVVTLEEGKTIDTATKI